ncbi:unnamed protein product [Arabidopsis thaliana]|uniref:(thale cress) hypothetical protein n=1 Tax=Arabidopsis thaliana TaxID=3702 RepID=A0A7G2FB50_ARATH|nr:unnamed protein product [Arabidopsis thaliana]
MLENSHDTSDSGTPSSMVLLMNPPPLRRYVLKPIDLEKSNLEFGLTSQHAQLGDPRGKDRDEKGKGVETGVPSLRSSVQYEKKDVVVKVKVEKKE